jgi:cyclic pyranopterin monophosphate synthase
MVDIGQKPTTQRFARASALVAMQSETLRRVRSHEFSKGDVLEVARLAGIMAAKRTSDLIPLCHPLALESVEIQFDFPDDQHVAVSPPLSRSPPRRVSRWRPWSPSRQPL